MLGVGFDAQVVHHLPIGLKRAFGRGAYALQTLREVAFYRFAPIRLRLDGQETQAASVIVSKGRLYGGRFLLAPTACPAQPGFSVVLFDHAGTAATLLYGAALPLDLLGRVPGVRHVRARQIDFIGNESALVQADGDAAGWTPITVTDAHGRDPGRGGIAPATAGAAAQASPGSASRRAATPCARTSWRSRRADTAGPALRPPMPAA